MTLAILQGPAFQEAVDRLATEIAQSNSSGPLMLLGIQRGGAPLARRLAPLVATARGEPAPVGVIDVTMYRDDLNWRQLPALQPTELPADINDSVIVLVDDVLFRGRTIRAALDALHDLGRPRRVQLAVLVDRGRRELPVRADFVGIHVDSTPEQRVRVRFAEDGGRDEALLVDAS